MSRPAQSPEPARPERARLPGLHIELAITETTYDDAAVASMIAELQTYYRSIYGGPDRSPVDPSEFARPAGRFYVGTTSGVPVAMGGWRRVEPMPGAGMVRPVEVKRMYVAPAARGNGFARAMLAHLEATAHADGADGVVLSTGAPQRAAIALYRACGYAEIPKFGYFARYEQSVHLGKGFARTAVAPRSDGGR